MRFGRLFWKKDTEFSVGQPKKLNESKRFKVTGCKVFACNFQKTVLLVFMSLHQLTKFIHLSKFKRTYTAPNWEFLTTEMQFILHELSVLLRLCLVSVCNIWHCQSGIASYPAHCKIIGDLNLVQQCCPVSPVFGFVLAVNSIIEQKYHKMLFKRAFTQKCWVVWVHGETFLCCWLGWGNYPRGKEQISCKRHPFGSRFMKFTVTGEEFHHPRLTGLSPAQARL